MVFIGVAEWLLGHGY